MKKIFAILLIMSILSSTKAQIFRLISPTVFQPVRYSAIAIADIDNDGDNDVFISGEDTNSTAYSILYENMGNFQFSTITLPIGGLSLSAAQWGDYNNDGYPDLLIEGYNGNNGFLGILKNNGDKTFTLINQNFPHVYMGDVAWVDYDNDGNLDFSCSGFEDQNNVYISKIFKNNGDGTFSEVNSANLPGTMYGKFKWADYDNDGYKDFILTGYADDFFTHIFKNNGDGTFSLQNLGLFQCWLGDVEWADYNNDGNIDLIISGTGGNDGTTRKTILYQNLGDGTFSAIENIFPGVSHSSIEWADFDLDGDLDLYISGTMNTPGSGQYISTIFKNENGTFIEDTSFAPNYWGDVKVADLNGDNRPDIIITGLGTGDKLFSALYENTPEPTQISQQKKLIKIVGEKDAIKITGTKKINSVEIYDIQGRQVYKTNVDNYQYYFNTTKIENGIYLLNVIVNGKKFSKKFVIIR